LSEIERKKRDIKAKNISKDEKELQLEPWREQERRLKAELKDENETQCALQ
jgi:hypothetical protein